MDRIERIIAFYNGFLIIVCLLCIYAIYRYTKIQCPRIPKEDYVLYSDPNTPCNYRVLISAQCSRYQDWQVICLLWSLRKYWPDVHATRILNCSGSDELMYPYTHTVPTYIVPDWSIHPKTKDFYPPYNRPVGLVYYMKYVSVPEEYMVILDPDIIVRKPLSDVPVRKGAPVAHYAGFMKDHFKTIADAYLPEDKKDNLQAMGVPIIIHREDLAQIAPLWLEYTEKIRNDPVILEEIGWISEMFGYSIAAALLGIQHDVRKDLQARVPYTETKDPHVLHYDLEHDVDTMKWDKRQYSSSDLLTEYDDTFPHPKNPPNHLFKQLFEVIHEAMEDANTRLKQRK